MSGAEPTGGRGEDVELAALSTILVRGPISRTELASRLALSQSTMTRAVKPLVQRGLVHETAERLEGPGRPSRPLVGIPGKHLFVGAKITGDEVFAVLTDLLANEIAAAERPLASNEPDSVADTVAAVARELAAGRELTAIGVSLGGATEDGRVVERAPYLQWRGVPFADILETRLGVPTVVDNDVFALTAGEHWFGVARGVPNFAVVTIGAGVGLSLVRDDVVVRGRDVGLGMAGHIPLDASGPLCEWGHRGCSAALLTIPSMEAQAAVVLRRPVSYEEVLTLAREGNPACAAIVDAAARALGRLLALVANLAMVEVIVLSGEGLALLDVAEDPMWAQLREYRDPEAHELELILDRAGFPRWARGAATMAIQASLRGLIAAPV